MLTKTDLDKINEGVNLSIVRGIILRIEQKNRFGREAVEIPFGDEINSGWFYFFDRENNQSMVYSNGDIRESDPSSVRLIPFLDEDIKDLAIILEIDESKLRDAIEAINIGRNLKEAFKIK